MKLIEDKKMKLKTLCLITLAGSAIAFNSGTANAFTLLGISDNSSGDHNSNRNVIHLDNFDINKRGIFFTGDAFQFATSTRFRIVITNASFTNKTSSIRSFQTNIFNPITGLRDPLLARGDYTLASSSGQLSALLSGQNKGISQTNGSEHLIVNASATTFNNNSAIASYQPQSGLPLIRSFSSSSFKNGSITGGAGLLSATGNIRLNPNESFILPNSIEIELRIPRVPEPSTLVGLGVIVGFGVFSKRQSLKKQQQ